MNLGEFVPSQTFDFKFTSRNNNIPATLAGTPVISVYKSNSTTQTTTGVTLTVDFDSVTGLNNVRINTSADLAFYTHTDEFDVVITTGTVGGNSVVGECVGHFTLARPALDRTRTGRLNGTHSATTADLGSNAPTQDVAGQIVFFPDHNASRNVDSYDTGTGIVTFSPSVAFSLVDNNNWVLLPTPPASTATIPQVDVVRISGDATAADNLESALDGTGGVTFSVVLGANAITATSIATNAIDADALATDAVTEIANGIWAFATRNVNVATVNGVAVIGVGSAVSPWRAA